VAERNGTETEAKQNKSLAVMSVVIATRQQQQQQHD